MGNVHDVEAQIQRKPKDAQLLHAAETGDEEQLRLLLRDTTIQVDFANSSALTPLFLAAKEGYTNCVRALLKAGAKVDGVGEGSSVLTPIWVATYGGHTECVSELINAGANMNAKYPETPLYIATREGRAGCLRLLINAGSDVNVRNTQGQTPLLVACRELHENCIELLLGTECDLDARDRAGYNILYYACNSTPDGSIILKMLLDAGMPVNGPCGTQGDLTPLHICAQRGKLENVRLLLLYGANASVRDSKGYTPQHKAANNLACQQLLQEHEGMVPLLQHLCRWSIRGLLGPKRLKFIMDLPIPTTLQNFLLYCR
ncbi:ankyrin repeat and SOCS box protein 5 [Nematostella vectensis]|uniref:ankyrin repeat and SOCS box protein 5 n=1 Tax=Nematostella vectensis TaxID=45351 RepID=UPI0013902D5D|nr:ankyrin repeat and SOCS box protein 5 [Nematostella vectensis]